MNSTGNQFSLASEVSGIGGRKGKFLSATSSQAGGLRKLERLKAAWPFGLKLQCLILEQYLRFASSAVASHGHCPNSCDEIAPRS